MLPEPYADEIKGISKAAGLEIGMYIRPLVKEPKSATMNIFRIFFLFFVDHL